MVEAIEGLFCIMKECTECKKIKKFSEFAKRSLSVDGYASKCKQCKGDYDAKYRTTFDGWMKIVYSTQKSSSKKRKQPCPNYTFNEFKVWVMKQDDLHRLWTDWENDGFGRWTRPSVDREKSTMPYTLDTIKLMTWKENCENAHKERKEGKLITSQNRKVKATNIKTGIVKIYYSQKEAYRDTGVANTTISACCRGVKSFLTGGGYKWEFVNN